MSMDDDRQPLYRLIGLTFAVVIGIGAVALVIAAVILLLF